MTFRAALSRTVERMALALAERCGLRVGTAVEPVGVFDPGVARLTALADLSRARKQVSGWDADLVDRLIERVQSQDTAVPWWPELWGVPALPLMTAALVVAAWAGLYGVTVTVPLDGGEFAAGGAAAEPGSLPPPVLPGSASAVSTVEGSE